MAIKAIIPTKVRAGLRRIFNYGVYRIVQGQRPICPSVRTLLGGTRPTLIISEPSTLARQLPHTVEPKLHEAFLQRTAFTLPSRYLLDIPNARLFGADGLIILPGGQYVAETVYGETELAQNRSYLALRLPKLRHQAGCYYSLLLGWWDNYFHWLFDVLPRLEGVLPHLPAELRFIVPADLRPYQYDALVALGLSEAQWVLRPASQMWELETLYYSPPQPVGARSPEGMLWVRDAIRTYFGTVNPRRGTTRIYISRRLASTRRFSNEPDIEALLAPYGFVTVTTETMTLSEQVALFAKAETVVAGHGAGLANLLFAPANTRVLEILPAQDVRSMYWEICEALGHSYHYLLAQSRGVNAELQVDLGKLKRALALLLS